MKYTKMHGAGNDFIIVNNLDNNIDPENYSHIAKKYCQRRLSIGADGMMFIEKSNTADFKMVFYNSDGTSGEMCGNGARCICRYGFEQNLCGTRQIIQTTAGIVLGERITETEYKIRLNDISKILDNTKLEIEGKIIDCGYVELGNPGIPHAVVELKNLHSMDKEELFRLGRAIRNHIQFPKGANVNFWCKINDNTFDIVTFERGVEDFTLACGTGCGSTAAILSTLGICKSEKIYLHCPGGELTVFLIKNGKQISDIFLSGPTCIVTTGYTVD